MANAIGASSSISNSGSFFARVRGTISQRRKAMEPGMNTAKQTGWARTAFCVALVISAQLGPSFAHAQATNRKAQAEGHYDQGKAYYKAGAFDLAVKEFLAGYELDPRAGVLFNVARAFEELKNPQKAIEYYKKYTDLGAAAAAATEARARIVVLERQIKEAEDTAVRRKTEEEEARKRTAEDAIERERLAKLAASQPAQPVVEEKPEGSMGVSTQALAAGDPEKANTLKLSGMISGGAGVLLTGLGFLFRSQASTLKNEVENEYRAMGWTDAVKQKDSDIDSKNLLTGISFIAGGLGLAAGGVLYYLGWEESNRVEASGVTSTALVPAVGPDGSASMMWAGRF